MVSSMWDFSETSKKPIECNGKTCIVFNEIWSDPKLRGLVCFFFFLSLPPTPPWGGKSFGCFFFFLRKPGNSSIPGHERRILIRIRQRASRCWACSLLNPLPCSCIPALTQRADPANSSKLPDVGDVCRESDFFLFLFFFFFPTRSCLKAGSSYNGCISCLELGRVSHWRLCWGKILSFWGRELAVWLRTAVWLWYPFAKSNTKN